MRSGRNFDLNSELGDDNDNDNNDNDDVNDKNDNDDNDDDVDEDLGIIALFKNFDKNSLKVSNESTLDLNDVSDDDDDERGPDVVVAESAEVIDDIDGGEAETDDDYDDINDTDVDGTNDTDDAADADDVDDVDDEARPREFPTADDISNRLQSWIETLKSFASAKNDVYTNTNTNTDTDTNTKIETGDIKARNGTSSSLDSISPGRLFFLSKPPLE